MLDKKRVSCSIEARTYYTREVIGVLSRRGFLSWFLGFLLLVAGCAPRKPAPKPNPAPAAPPPPAPPPLPRAITPPPPAPKPAAPQPQPKSSPASPHFYLRNDEKALEATLREMTPELNKLVTGKRKEIKIEGEGLQPLTLKFAGDPKVSKQPHLIVSTADGQALHAVPEERKTIAFKKTNGDPVRDDNGILGPKGQELRIKISQLWEFLKKLNQKLETPTLVKVAAIAILTLLAAKIGILVLGLVIAVVLVVLLLATIAVLLRYGIGGLRLLGKEIRSMLAEAGIKEKDIDDFLAKTSVVAQQVLAAVITELRKRPEFVQ